MFSDEFICNYAAKVMILFQMTKQIQEKVLHELNVCLFNLQTFK